MKQLFAIAAILFAASCTTDELAESSTSQNEEIIVVVGEPAPDCGVLGNFENVYDGDGMWVGCRCFAWCDEPTKDPGTWGGGGGGGGGGGHDESTDEDRRQELHSCLNRCDMQGGAGASSLGDGRKGPPGTGGDPYACNRSCLHKFGTGLKCDASIDGMTTVDNGRLDSDGYCQGPNGFTDCASDQVDCQYGPEAGD